MNTWQMASRNLMRARRRSSITVLAMALALGIMIAYSGLFDGMMSGMKENAIMLDMGHIQIHAEGYRDTPSIYTRITDAEDITQNIIAKGYMASERLFANGLVAKGNSSAGVMLRGVDAEGEEAAMQLPGHVKNGKWLSKDDQHGVVLGFRLAKTLSAKIGDEIVFVSQAADGSMANDLYTVRGTLKSAGEMIDRSGLFMNIDAFRELMVIENGAHEIVVTIDEEKNLEEAVGNIKNMAKENEVLSWQEINPSLFEMLNASKSMMIPMIVITYIAIAIVILNAMLMAVFERIKEYGVMKALGMGPLGIFNMVVAETMLMAITATVLGLLLGISLSWYFQTYGIDLTSVAEGATFSGVAYNSIWKSKLTLESVLQPVIVLYIMVALAAIYPAVKAARLNPIEAIHHN